MNGGTKCSTGSALAPSMRSWSAAGRPRRARRRGPGPRLGRRFAELAPIVAAPTNTDSTTTTRRRRELAAEDPSFAAEAEQLSARMAELEDRLRELLLPKDPNDGKDVILEIKAGEGGDESALFAGDLLRMYLRYAERQGWTTEMLDTTAPTWAGKVGHGGGQGRGRPGPAASGPG